MTVKTAFKDVGGTHIVCRRKVKIVVLVGVARSKKFLLNETILADVGVGDVHRSCWIGHLRVAMHPLVIGLR